MICKIAKSSQDRRKSSNHGNQRPGRKGWVRGAEGAGREAAVLRPFPGDQFVAGKSIPKAASSCPKPYLFASVRMEIQPGEQAATEPPDSGAGGGDGRPPHVAGAQETRPEDRLTLLLRLFPLVR